MQTMTAEARFDEAERVREMVALVESLLAGQVTRGDALDWADRLIYSRKIRYFRSVPAHALLSCILDLDKELGGEPLVREIDLVAHLEAIRIGSPPFSDERLAHLTLAPDDVATRVGGKLLRFYVDGLGWFDSCSFASPATGRRFTAQRPTARADMPTPADASTEVLTYDKPGAAVDRAAALAELFDTLCIDMDDVKWSDVPITERWRLLRSDDNGNTLLVRKFSGYAKARRALADYEAKLHKQSYWLEREV